MVVAAAVVATVELATVGEATVVVADLVVAAVGLLAPGLTTVVSIGAAVVVVTVEFVGAAVVSSLRVVGTLVGDSEGDFVGGVVGDVVGDLLGDFVGEFVGDSLGEGVGDFVGDVVGVLDGDIVGELVGNFVGELVGATVSTRSLHVPSRAARFWSGACPACCQPVVNTHAGPIRMSSFACTASTRHQYVVLTASNPGSYTLYPHRLVILYPVLHALLLGRVGDLTMYTLWRVTFSAWFHMRSASNFTLVPLYFGTGVFATLVWRPGIQYMVPLSEILYGPAV